MNLGGRRLAGVHEGVFWELRNDLELDLDGAHIAV